MNVHRSETSTWWAADQAGEQRRGVGSRSRLPSFFSLGQYDRSPPTTTPTERPVTVAADILEEIENTAAAVRPTAAPAPAPARLRSTQSLGERVRQLRAGLNMTQTRARGLARDEGVHLADRARQGAADRGDGRLARRAPRGRRALSRQRHDAPRLRLHRGDRQPRRGRRRGPALRRGRRGARGSHDLSGSARAAAPRAARGELGTDADRQHPHGDGAARDGPHARARQLRRARAGRGALPARRLPLQAFLDLDVARPPERGPVRRGAEPAAERPPPGGHPRLALALLPAPARLGGRARGHRAQPRAGRAVSTTSSPSRTRSSRLRSSPSGAATGCARARTPRRRRASTSRSTTRSTSAGC